MNNVKIRPLEGGGYKVVEVIDDKDMPRRYFYGNDKSPERTMQDEATAKHAAQVFARAWKAEKEKGD